MFQQRQRVNNGSGYRCHGITELKAFPTRFNSVALFWLQ